MRVQEKCKSFTRKYIVDRQNPFINTGILFFGNFGKKKQGNIRKNFKHTLEEVSTMMSKVTYNGDLRTEAYHIQSGISIVTDAPIDNQGKERHFLLQI